MDHYAGIDVSLECSSVCVVDASGKIVREGKVASEPEALIAWFGSLGLGARADRTGGRPAVAMALCGDEGSGACGRTAGDAARARCVQGDAGEDRSQRCARHCATDAAWLVPAGALQVDGGAGDAGDADRAQAGADAKLRDVENSLRGHLARLWSEGRARRPRGALPARIEDLVAGHPTLERIAEALLAVRAVLLREFNAFEKQVRTMARSDARARLLMSTPAVGPIVALTYAPAIDDPARFTSSKQAGAHFGLTPKKYQSGETDYQRPDQQDRRRVGARGALRGRPHHADQAGQGLLGTEELGDADRQARRHAARRRWRWRASSP